MKKFYLRWSGILVLGIIISLIAAQRYISEVSVVTPDQLGKETVTKPVRVQGMIVPGTLKIAPDHHDASFDLSGKQKKIPVHFTGEEIDNLREFKVIVLFCTFDAVTGRFESSKMALNPNYGFITAAYLIGLLPLAFYLFNMERKVVLLYDTIKQEKIYQPEETI